MDVMHTLRSALDRSVGNAGALRNCRLEQLERMRAEADLEQVRARIEASVTSLPAGEATHRASA